MNKRLLHQLLRTGFIAAIIVISPLTLSVQAAEQYTTKELRAMGIYFLGDLNTQAATTVSGPVAGSGSCYELPLPQINDQAVFAKAINDYLDQNAPASSPFKGLGADIIQGSVRYSVNPMFVVGNMRMESQYGTSGTGGGTSIAELLHQHNNAFGRTSPGEKQPGFLDNNGRRWYSYPSWKESINSPTSTETNRTDQQSLMKVGYLDAGDITLAQYLKRYAPATDGNNESVYAQTVTDTIQKIIALAGSALSCQDNTTTVTPDTPVTP